LAAVTKIKSASPKVPRFFISRSLGFAAGSDKTRRNRRVAVDFKLQVAICDKKGCVFTQPFLAIVTVREAWALVLAQLADS